MTASIVAIFAACALAGPAPSGLPPNVAIAATYRAVVGEMFRYSPTFRRQCNRLARASTLQVEIRVARLPDGTTDEALTRIVRRPDGVIEAGVQVGSSGDPALLIAHEFEHILEQLDGVDLPLMATRAGSGVHRVPGSRHFETDRAIAAGHRVQEEVSRGRTRDGS
jgi:hypothetical protein